MVFSSWNFFPNNVTKSRRVAKASVEPASGIGDTFGPDGSPATDPMIRIHEIHAIPLTRLTYAGFR